MHVITKINSAHAHISRARAIRSCHVSSLVPRPHPQEGKGSSELWPNPCGQAGDDSSLRGGEKGKRRKREGGGEKGGERGGKREEREEEREF